MQGKVNFLYVEPYRKAPKLAVTVNAVAMKAEKHSQAQGQVGIHYRPHIVNIILNREVVDEKERCISAMEETELKI